MFPLGGKTSVLSYCRPIISKMLNGGRALIDHWLNRKNHSFFKPNSLALLSIVGNLGFFVHQLSNSMPAILLDDRVAASCCVLANAKANIADSVARFHLF